MSDLILLIAGDAVELAADEKSYMFVTFWCITVIMISMMAVGVPLRWLLGGRKPLNELAWIEAPFLGIAAIALVLQNFIYLDTPVRLSTPVIWIGVLLLWIYFYRRGQLRECLRACPIAPFAGALFVYLFQESASWL